MAFTVVENPPYLISYDHYNFYIFNTETGVITDRWGQPVKTSLYIWNQDMRGKKYEGWFSLLDITSAVPCAEIARQLYPAWKALAETGIFLSYSMMGGFPNKALSFARAIMEWRDSNEIRQGTYYITDYYLMLVEQFFIKYDGDRHYYNESSSLFQRVFLYETPEDAAYLYNLIRREGTIEFWGEKGDALALHHYCLEKHRRNEPLTEVRNLWNDFSKTLQGVIAANPIVSEIMEEEK